MKAEELRELTSTELNEELDRLHKEQFNLRLMRATDLLPQVHLMKKTRRDIARVKTILREKNGG